MASAVATAAVTAATKQFTPLTRKATGIVISSGLCQNTVKVQIGGEIWNKKVQKHFKKPECHLVDDPNSSLRTGDIVEIVTGWRSSKMKRFVVNRIIAPFGLPIEERPPVLTAEERDAIKAAKREKKLERRHLRNQRVLAEARVNRATKLTDEITKMAWKMKLSDNIDWSGNSMKA